MTELFANSAALPRKRALNLSVPDRESEVRLEYVQSDLSDTVRVLSVVVRRWMRTLMEPLHPLAVATPAGRISLPLAVKV